MLLHFCFAGSTVLQHGAGAASCSTRLAATPTAFLTPSPQIHPTHHNLLQPAAPWYLVVARPTLSVAAYPRQEDLTAFRIPPGVFVKLHKGTWHAGARGSHGRRGCQLAGLAAGWAGHPHPSSGTTSAATSSPEPSHTVPCIPPGPLFDGESASFYNLELADTNVTDHNTHDYSEAGGQEYEVIDE